MELGDWNIVAGHVLFWSISFFLFAAASVSNKPGQYMGSVL